MAPAGALRADASSLLAWGAVHAGMVDHPLTEAVALALQGAQGEVEAGRLWALPNVAAAADAGGNSPE
jgi:hypothetical protein